MVVISGTGIVWDAWANSTTSTTSATTDVFTYWTTHWNSTGTTTNTTTDTIYRYWANENQVAMFQAHEMRQRERQQIRIERERNIWQQNEQSERQIRQVEARRKAKILLLENLDNEQVKDFQKGGFFFVKSPSGRLYRIREGRAINIDLMVGNSRSDVEKRLCGHPEIFCPNEDTMLAQKIYLEKLENDFLRIARTYEPLH
jgi:hypothetical protein